MIPDEQSTIAGHAAEKVAPQRFPTFWYALLLVVAIWLVYWQVGSHKFLIYDDRTYVDENSIVLQGLTWPSVRWALTAFHDANWFPLTWLSHMLDVQLFGRAPVGHHLVNVGIHSLNALLCFIVLTRMTGNAWRSALVAAIFALHPLRVESVAWVAERKDVLSALFWFLTMLAYGRYVRLRSLAAYLLTVLCFTLGLLAKPMLVTLPFILLLLDYWPLGRIATMPFDTAAARYPQVSIRRVLLEKLPLLLLAVASSVITFIAQRNGGTVSSFDQQTLLANVANAFVSYLVYLRQLFWPTNLAVFYPFKEANLLWLGPVSVVVLVAISLVVVRQLRQRPYVAIGWFWYLVAMVPVIGFVKVGAHAHADRYTYLPLIGITLLLVWLAADLTRTWRPQWRAALAGLLILSCGLLTYQQVGYWHDSFTLFRRTLAVTENNWLAHNNLAAELIKWGAMDEAIEHLNAAIKIKPDYASAYINLGVVYTNLQQRSLAIAAYSRAIKEDPDAVAAHYNLGIALLGNDDIRGAAAQYRALLPLDARQADALQGMIQFALGRQGKAGAP
jgi:hypothetical protein